MVSNAASSQELVPRGFPNASSAAGGHYLALVLTRWTAAWGRGVLEREILRLWLSGGCRGPWLRREELQEGGERAGEVDALVSGSHAALPNGEHMRPFVLVGAARNKGAARVNVLLWRSRLRVLLLRP